MLFIRIWATLKQLTKSEVAGELNLCGFQPVWNNCFVLYCCERYRVTVVFLVVGTCKDFLTSTAQSWQYMDR